MTDVLIVKTVFVLNMEKWFKAKRYGLGWVPASPEGWIVLFVYLALAIFFFRKVDATSHSNSDTLIGFALPFIVLTIILIIICYLKGDKPYWRWGDQNGTDKK